MGWIKEVQCQQTGARADPRYWVIDQHTNPEGGLNL